MDFKITNLPKKNFSVSDFYNLTVNRMVRLLGTEPLWTDELNSLGKTLFGNKKYICIRQLRQRDKKYTAITSSKSKKEKTKDRRIEKRC